MRILLILLFISSYAMACETKILVVDGKILTCTVCGDETYCN
jgi:hypothetical protein